MTLPNYLLYISGGVQGGGRPGEQETGDRRGQKARAEIKKATLCCLLLLIIIQWKTLPSKVLFGGVLQAVSLENSAAIKASHIRPNVAKCLC